MSQQTKVGSHKTSIKKDELGQTCIQYHDTIVVRFNDDVIVLRNGYDKEWKTMTTKTRMNQWYRQGSSLPDRATLQPWTAAPIGFMPRTFRSRTRLPPTTMSRRPCLMCHGKRERIRYTQARICANHMSSRKGPCC